MHKIYFSTTDKNLKSDTGVRPDNNKSQAAESLEKSYSIKVGGQQTKPTKQAEPLYPFILYSLSCFDEMPMTP